MARLNARRIALVANPGADLYGSDRMTLETVSALVDAGWRVVSAVASDGPLVTELRLRGAEVTVTPTPVARKSSLSFAGLIRLAASAVTGSIAAIRLMRSVRPDVVYVNTVTIPLWLLIARLFRTRVVCHVHEAENTASRALLRVLNAPLFLAHAILVNSEFSRGVLATAFRSLSGRSTVVYNFVRGPEAVTPARSELDAPLRLLYIGRLSPRKGPDVAIAAVELLVRQNVDVHLELVGDVFPGYEWFRADLERTVDQHELQSCVTFRGFLPTGWDALASADIVLVPSTVDEPFGNTAVEAALGGRPSVVSGLGGLGEATAGFASRILVEPSNPQAIVAAVEQICQRWKEYRDAALDDRRVALERFSRETYSAAVIAMLDDR